MFRTQTTQKGKWSASVGSDLFDMSQETHLRSSFSTAILLELLIDHAFWFVSFVLGLADFGLPVFVRLFDSFDFLLFGGGKARPTLFRRGIGDIQQFIQRRDIFYKALDEGRAVTDFLQSKDIEWGQPNHNYFLGVTIQQASFQSPIAKPFLPVEASTCHFHLVQPNPTRRRDSCDVDGSSKTTGTTCVILLPATGEETIHSRLPTAVWNARIHGWSTLILTAAFYGIRRRPQKDQQQGVFMETVADQMLQSQAIVEETALLTQYLLRSAPTNRVVLTGFSFGGACALAAGASTLSILNEQEKRRLAVAPLAGATSHAAYADGMLLSCINLDAFVEDDNPVDERTAIRTTDEAMITQRLRELLRDSELKPGRMVRNLVSTTNEKDNNASRRQQTRIGAVCVHSFYHDKFVTEKYTRLMLDDLHKHQDDDQTFSFKWLPGGHSFACVLSPYFLYRVISNAVSCLDEDLTVQ